MAPSPARRSLVRSVKRGRGRPRTSLRNIDFGSPRPANSRRSTAGAYTTPRGRPPKNRGQGYSTVRRRTEKNTRNEGDSTVYKPREEKSYEEIHPDLDVEAALPIFEAEVIDGVVREEELLQQVATGQAEGIETWDGAAPTPVRSVPGLNKLDIGAATPIPTIIEPRNSEFVDTGGFGHAQSPTAESAVSSNGATFPFNLAVPSTPGPGSAEPDTYTPSRSRGGRFGRAQGRRPGKATQKKNQDAEPPKEIFDLPKASFKILTVPDFGNGAFGRGSVDPTGTEHRGEPTTALMRTEVRNEMVKIGFQTTNVWKRPKHLLRDNGNYYEEDDVGVGLGTATSLKAEYDMDEQDNRWLSDLNELRRSMDLAPIPHEIFELAMTRIEREWCALERRIPRKPPKNQYPHAGTTPVSRHLGAGWGPDEMGDGDGEAEDTKCNICDDGECENSNAIVFCDGCDLAVHQDCYGIPHIPEGQYHCRKCMFANSQVVHCVLCPNTDGAFKQTSNNGWAHLLCAMWIPELSLGNPVYMEPVDGLDKIPRSRWKLHCYICRQKTGACIQCSNKTCYVAFHVTCARKAKLFLKMPKNPNGSPPFDQSQLRALCHRHVPPDWREEHDVDRVFEETAEYYRTNFAGYTWDSNPVRAIPIPPGGLLPDPYGSPMQLQVSSKKMTPSPSKRKRSSPKKPPWKLPSGAPVIPQVIYRSVIDSLGVLKLQDCEEYVAEVCKYWALKREARRGAPLIKRFQSQVDTFTSMEVTRKNYAVMQQGQEKLELRTEFARIIKEDMMKLKELADEVAKRESNKRELDEMMVEFVMKAYLPEGEFIWPIYQAASKIDSEKVFAIGWKVIGSRIEDGLYTSIDTFFLDLQQMLLSPPNAPEFAVVISEGLPVSPESLPPRVEQNLTTLASSEPHPVSVKVFEEIKPLVAQAKRSEAELDYDPSGRAPEEIAQYWENFERTVAHTITPLPIALTSDLITNLEKVKETHIPRSPTASDDSAYHTPPTIPSRASRPPSMWHEGKPPWYLADFDPKGLEYYEERWVEREQDLAQEGSPISEVIDPALEDAPMGSPPVESVDAPAAEHIPPPPHITASPASTPPPVENGFHDDDKSKLLSSLPLSPPPNPTPSEPLYPALNSSQSQLPSPAVTTAANLSPEGQEPPIMPDDSESPLSSLASSPGPAAGSNAAGALEGVNGGRLNSVTGTPKREKGIGEAELQLTPRRASERVKAKGST